MALTIMTSLSQNRLWMQPSPYPNRVYYNKSIMYANHSEQNRFVTVRRSRKGTNLHIPEEFNKTLREQTSIVRFDILPRAGCCDLNYVLFRQNTHNHKLLSHQEQTPHNCLSGYTSSVTINIGSPPFNQKQLHQSQRRKKSYSTLSINPTVVSEEPWIESKNVIPTGLYCCSNKPICEHTQSQEQGVINLDVSQRHLNDEKFIYITVAPKISPLKSCFNFLTCKKKKYQGEPYNPTIMTKNKIPLECVGCPKDVEQNGKPTSELEKKHFLFVPSRLSTITESDITVSEYSSEEFDPLSESEQKAKKKSQRSRDIKKTITEPCSSYIKKTNTESGKLMCDSNSIAVYPSSLYPEGEIHRWVCKPSGDHGKKGKQQYVCYLK